MSAKEWKLILIQSIAAATVSWLHNLQNSHTVQDKQKLNTLKTVIHADLCQPTKYTIQDKQKLQWKEVKETPQT